MDLNNFFKKETPAASHKGASKDSQSENTNSPIFTNGASDDRSEDAKSKDYLQEEIATASTVDWKEKPQSEWKSYPVRNQGSAGTCVMQSIAKLLGVENLREEGLYVELSAADGYSLRGNKEISGSTVDDAVKIVTQTGLTLQEFSPDQELTEEQANNAKPRTPLMDSVAKILKGKSVIFLNGIDEMASVIEQGKAISLWFRWDYLEWDKDVPMIEPDSKKRYGHAVSGVDFTLYQGKKSIIIDDSWGKNRGIKGQRIITEDWFTSGRCFVAFYIGDLKNARNENQIKPGFKFTKELSLKMNDPEVRGLQMCLSYLKDGNGFLFPIISTDFTGYFGGITRQAVKRYQTMRNLPVTGIIDRITREALNTEFSI